MAEYKGERGANVGVGGTKTCEGCAKKFGGYPARFFAAASPKVNMVQQGPGAKEPSSLGVGASARPFTETAPLAKSATPSEIDPPKQPVMVSSAAARWCGFIAADWVSGSSMVQGKTARPRGLRRDGMMLAN